MGLQKTSLKSRNLLSLLLALCIIFSFSMTSMAATGNNNYSKLKAKIKQLNSKAQGISITIDESKLTTDFLNSLAKKSDKDLDEYLNSIYTNAKNVEVKVVTTSPNDTKSVSPATKSVSPTVNAAAVNATYTNRTAQVWFGIPAVGWTYMNILYDITLTPDHRYFVSGNVKGSWQTGVGIGQWTHKYGYVTVSYTTTYADVCAVGVLTYGIKGTPFSVSTTQTVAYQDHTWNY